ncbi:hypothetical protein ADIWIN_2342 [Winogradskyella psychrotolerans RS-3]|uniref:Uncharacterized protein n=1 Tax=Winogradskyella psychrotolerans RS-3 TaxID=641526 RepID=S7X154_9FLAO|nr:hypothetical protein ADIWIN_2342 [Winogradskyella psychrotolerans RS-3]
MSAAAFATIATFQVVLLSKTAVTFGCQIIITVFNWDVFFHS